MKEGIIQRLIVGSQFDASIASKLGILEESVLMRRLRNCANIVGLGLMTFTSCALTNFVLDAINRAIEQQIAENQYWRVQNAKILVIHSKNV